VHGREDSLMQKSPRHTGGVAGEGGGSRQRINVTRKVVKYSSFSVSVLCALHQELSFCNFVNRSAHFKEATFRSLHCQPQRLSITCRNWLVHRDERIKTDERIAYEINRRRNIERRTTGRGPGGCGGKIRGSWKPLYDCILLRIGHLPCMKAAGSISKGRPRFSRPRTTAGRVLNRRRPNK